MDKIILGCIKLSDEMRRTRIELPSLLHLIVYSIMCKWCNCPCVKAGKQKDGTQKYQCKSCTKYQQRAYRYLAYDPAVHDQFRRFEDMGVGVNKAAKFLQISVNTFQKWVLKAENLKPIARFPKGCTYDIDEVQTYIGKRENKYWITYGWNVDVHAPIGLNVGGRSSRDLKGVVDDVLANQPKKINTDRYLAYPGLIPQKLHSRGKRKANCIENKHKSLRKDIAYLIRETMCFAKSRRMLEARIRWYFWAKMEPDFFLK